MHFYHLISGCNIFDNIKPETKNNFSTSFFYNVTIHVAGDFLSIYDGDSDTSPMLGNPYCGDSLPPSRISSSNHLFFRFISDFYGTATGFRLEYNATSKRQESIQSRFCGGL